MLAIAVAATVVAGPLAPRPRAARRASAPRPASPSARRRSPMPTVIAGAAAAGIASPRAACSSISSCFPIRPGRRPHRRAATCRWRWPPQPETRRGALRGAADRLRPRSALARLRPAGLFGVRRQAATAPSVPRVTAGKYAQTGARRGHRALGRRRGRRGFPGAGQGQVLRPGRDDRSAELHRRVGGGEHRRSRRSRQ